MEQLKKKSPKDLEIEVREHLNQLWGLRRELSQGKAKNVRDIKRFKKAIARIRTIQSWSKKQEQLSAK